MGRTRRERSMESTLASLPPSPSLFFPLFHLGSYLACPRLFTFLRPLCHSVSARFLLISVVAPSSSSSISVGSAVGS